MRVLKGMLAIAFLVVALGLAGFAVAVAVYQVPEPNDIAVAEATEVYYAGGEEKIGDIGTISRVSIPLEQVPEHVQNAILAAEDRDFYSHTGFSVPGIFRAVVNNAAGGETQGASTITQQYVKNAFLSHDQTLTRKAEELVLAVKTETSTSKEQILEGYLNTIYFGRGAYGIEAAADVYFDKSASELKLAEGAALAAIIQSPGNFEPRLNRDGLQARWTYVLDGMEEEGWIGEKRRAKQTYPAFVEPPIGDRLGGQTGHLLEQARRELISQGWDEAQIDGGGIKIITTINPQAQQALEDAIVEAGPQSDTEGLRIGAAAVNPNNGRILALYGGPDYVEDQLNNATQATAQAGSTFKPFALVAAYERGYSPYSVLNGDSPRTFGGYTVPNEGDRDYGNITLTQAAQNSVNTVFVDLANRVGINNVIDAAYRAGLPRDTPGAEPYLPFVLGAPNPHALDMASAYATFAASGVYHEPTMVAKVVDVRGEVLYRDKVRGEQTIDAAVADTVTQTLKAVVDGGSGYRAQELGRPAAGKTGTTDDNISAWYVGYTPQVSLAVMMTKEDEAGYPVTLRGTGGLEKVFGGSFPAAIWTAFAIDYHEGREVGYFPTPGSSGGDAPAAPQPEPAFTPQSTPEPSREPIEGPTEEPSADTSQTPSQDETSAPPDTGEGEGDGDGDGADSGDGDGADSGDGDDGSDDDGATAPTDGAEASRDAQSAGGEDAP